MMSSLTHLAPSPWVMQQALLWPKDGRVLDFASGRGRHSRLLAERFQILAVDRDADALTPLAAYPRIDICLCDLETDAAWPFAGEKFDVVLVDIRLPDTNGHDLVKKIKKRSPDGEHMIFIAITAHNAQDYAEVSESIGIDYHLTKPVTAEDLKRALSVAVAYSAN